MSAAAAQMVALTGGIVKKLHKYQMKWMKWVFRVVVADPSEIDYTAVGTSVSTLSSNLTELAKGM